jgi:predicted metallopeptidase
MTVAYRRAEDSVLNLVVKIQRQHHQHLRGQRLEVVFRSEAAKDRGKVVLGKARKVTGLNAFLAHSETEPFFLIELAEDVWETLTDEAREALIDHELSHFGVAINDQAETVLQINPHDLEEFNDIVRRHGLWRADLEAFAAAAQLLLFEPTKDRASSDEPVPAGVLAGTRAAE